MRVRLGVAALMCFLGVPALAGVSATVIPGDSIRGDLAAGEEDRFEFGVFSPASLSAKISADAGMNVEVRIIAPNGEPMDLTGMLFGSPGSAPSLKGVQLLSRGSYTLVVSGVVGEGEYTVATKLGKARAAALDLRDGGTTRGSVVIDGRCVRFDPAGTAISGTNAQAAISELDSRTTAAAAGVSQIASAISAQSDALTQATSGLTALDNRTDVLESAASAAAAAIAALQAAGKRPANCIHGVRGYSF